ncbi:RNA polymerase sigma factor [Kribbella solani]|uniref:RNA polymerase sigma factor n=1 Tax=Kribbella solani TaxID=236067 RepID=UPI0029B28540|nr:RNA polymerase sigma factor [Kribbella solani]MDX2972071.1 RNA polymerase sigma factor [Kribbella solani]
MTETPIRPRLGPVSEDAVHDPPLDDRRQRFEEVFGTHREAVLGYLLRRTGSSHDAADLLSDTFVIAWRRLEEVPAGDQTRPWLFGVARRVLANHRRGEVRRMALTYKLRDELTDTSVPGPEFSDADSTMARAFRALPEPDRELLTLVAWEDLSTAQIATVLGCSRNAVRIRLFRARRRFTELVADRSNAAPSNAVSSNAVPSNAVLSNTAVNGEISHEDV